MLKKKLMAVVAACALALALPTAAFAADGWNFGPGSMQFAGCMTNQSFDTTAEGYECVATFDVTGEHDAATPVLNGPVSAVGAQVTVSGAVNATGTMIKANGMGGEIARFAINVPENVTGTITVKVGNGPAVTPPAATDTTDPADTTDKANNTKPAASNTNNGTAGSTNNTAKAADGSKTSPKTGVDMGGVALATAGALAAAGCVAFALRKKIAINE